MNSSAPDIDNDIERHIAALGDLVTGVPEIDDEHAYLIDLESRLAAALRSDDSAAAAAIFNDLLEYMAEHFTHEETLMGCLSAAAAARHKEEHANISGRLIQSIGRPGAPAQFPIAPKELAAVIAIWLENHIRYYDMPLAKVIQARANEATADRNR